MIDYAAEIKKIARMFDDLALLSPKIAEAASLCIEALRRGNKILFCGNGGSASQAQHLAAELVGRYKRNRPAMGGISLTVDTSILTSVGNDYGFNEIFSRQVEGIGRAGDVLIGLSTSGNSKNVIRAFEKAREMGISTIAFVGSAPARLEPLADTTLAVPSDIANNAQEMHLAVGHLICDAVEEAFYDGYDTEKKPV